HPRREELATSDEGRRELKAARRRADLEGEFRYGGGCPRVSEYAVGRRSRAVRLRPLRFAGGRARRHGRAAGRVRDRHAARVRAEAAVPGRHHGYWSRPGLALLPEPVPAWLLHRYL